MLGWKKKTKTEFDRNWYPDELTLVTWLYPQLNDQLRTNFFLSITGEANSNHYWDVIDYNFLNKKRDKRCTTGLLIESDRDAGPCSLLASIQSVHRTFPQFIVPFLVSPPPCPCRVVPRGLHFSFHHFIISSVFYFDSVSKFAAFVARHDDDGDVIFIKSKISSRLVLIRRFTCDS